MSHMEFETDMLQSGMLKYRVTKATIDTFSKATLPVGTVLWRYDPIDYIQKQANPGKSAVFYDSDNVHTQDAVAVNVDCVKFAGEPRERMAYAFDPDPKDLTDLYQHKHQRGYSKRDSGLYSSAMLDDAYGYWQTPSRVLAKPPEGWHKHDDKAPDTYFNFEAA